MRARDIVGKKVVKVSQERTYDTGDRLLYALEAVVFEDGTELQFTVAELHGDYAVEGIVLKPEK